jgi:hypothetical protein
LWSSLAAITWVAAPCDEKKHAAFFVSPGRVMSVNLPAGGTTISFLKTVTLWESNVAARLMPATWSSKVRA